MVIVTTAVVTNAASINWQISGYGTTSGHAYLIDTSSTSVAAFMSLMALPTTTHLNGTSLAAGVSDANNPISAGLMLKNNAINDLLKGDDPELFTAVLYSTTVANVGTYYWYTLTTPQVITITSDSGAFKAQWTAFGSPVQYDFVPIPEPATMALVGIGIMAFGLRRRRK